jgi:hypothetical protein
MTTRSMGDEMTYADRLNRWNQWYDSTPEEWRSQIVLWPLLLLGFINMQMTIAGGFPFGLLVLLGLIAVAAVRLPYTLGWIKPGRAEGDGARIELGRIDWLYDLNNSYDALPTHQRFWIIPAILIVVGAINMKLTLAAGYPFGLLFLIALLAIILVRAPFAAGLVTPPPAMREASLVPHWLSSINGRYDSMPPAQRFYSFVAAVVIITGVSLDLTLTHGMPFFLLFLIAFLVIIAVRAPYVAGWISNGQPALTHDSPVLALEQTPALSHITTGAGSFAVGGQTVGHGDD